MIKGNEASTSSSATIADSCEITSVARLLTHLKQPSNLLNYMIFTAWAKFMGIVNWIPTITIGG